MKKQIQIVKFAKNRKIFRKIKPERIENFQKKKLQK